MTDYTKSSLDNKDLVNKPNATSDTEKVVSARIEEPKPLSRGQKFAAFSKSMAKEMNESIIKPTIKKLVYDTIVTAAGSVLHIGPGATQRLINAGVNASKVSYNQCYNNPGFNQIQPGAINFNIEGIHYTSNMEADLVLQKLDELMSIRGRASVADLYAASGLACDYTYGYWGWIGSLSNARAVMVTTDDWILKMPRPVQLPI